MPEEVIGYRLPVSPHTVVGSHDGSGQAITHFTTPDGRLLLATCGDDEVIRLWDPGTGEQLRVIETPGHWLGEPSVFLDGDRPRILTRDFSTLRLWDPLTGEELPLPDFDHEDFITATAVHTDAEGRVQVASVSRNGTVAVHDLASGVSRELEDAGLGLLDVPDGAPSDESSEPTGRVIEDCSPLSGDRIITVGDGEAVVRLWPREGEPAGSIAVDGMPEALSTLPDSHLGVGFIDGLVVVRPAPRWRR